MPRCVVQEHFTTPHHFDLMLERDGALATWSLPAPPEAAALAAGMTVLRLPDHRLAYLDYEGEVSGGRGSVKIWTRGDYAATAWDEREVRVEVETPRWRGAYVLAATDRSDAGRPVWRLRPAP